MAPYHSTKPRFSTKSDATKPYFHCTWFYAAAVSSGTTTTTTSHIPRLTEHQNATAAAANLASKRFKMLRLKKDNTNSEELGIVISKKRNPQKGTSGYIIAHIEPEGLVER